MACPRSVLIDEDLRALLPFIVLVHGADSMLCFVLGARTEQGGLDQVRDTRASRIGGAPSAYPLLLYPTLPKKKKKKLSSAKSSMGSISNARWLLG